MSTFMRLTSASLRLTAVGPGKTGMSLPPPAFGALGLAVATCAQQRDAREAGFSVVQTIPGHTRPDLYATLEEAMPEQALAACDDEDKGGGTPVVVVASDGSCVY